MSGSRFDLNERTQHFAREVFHLVNELPRSISNEQVLAQLARSAASVGANYIEANEALGKKDFLFHLKVSRKEAKESRYWLELLSCPERHQAERTRLVKEATELLLIFSAIIRNSTGKP